MDESKKPMQRAKIADNMNVPPCRGTWIAVIGTVSRGL
jgi:hypothetical protein